MDKVKEAIANGTLSLKEKEAIVEEGKEEEAKQEENIEYWTQRAQEMSFVDTVDAPEAPEPVPNTRKRALELAAENFKKPRSKDVHNLTLDGIKILRQRIEEDIGEKVTYYEMPYGSHTVMTYSWWEPENEVTYHEVTRWLSSVFSS